MRAVIYTRVSSDAHGRGRSVAEQEAECRAFCDREGWEVSDVLTDNDIGASRFSGRTRPAYLRLAEVLKAGDVLVTWEASRAQRDLDAYVALRNLCAERKVLWSYSGRTFDLQRGDDRFTTGLDALLAEKEAEEIRGRVLRAQRANAEQGLAHGRIPYGYSAKRDERTGQITDRVPDCESAPIVREMARRCLAGEPIRSITRDLNARGVPTSMGSGPWRTQMVSRILQSPTYAGLRIHLGHTRPGVWEPLISVEDHQRLVSILQDPARRTQRGMAPKHLLTGIARCGECKSKLWRLKSGGNSAYTCMDNRCVSRKMKPVDMLVTELVLAKLETVSCAADLEDSGAKEAEKQARELRARLDGFTDKAADGGLSPAALARIEAKLLPQIKAAERRSNSSLPPEVAELIGPHARSRWVDMLIPGRRNVISALLDVQIHPAPRGRIFRPEFVEVTWR